MPRRDTATRKRGNRTVLTPAKADKIIQAVQAGNHVTTACALADIGHSTLYRWLDHARDVDEALATGEPFNPEWLPYRDLRDRLQRARAEAEDTMVDVIRRDAVGGFITSEEPVVNGDGEVQYDEDGNVLWKRTYTSPNGRLALEYLSRSAPDRWGRKDRVLVDTGDNLGLTPIGPTADEGATGTEDPEAIERAMALASRLAITARERSEGVDEVQAGNTRPPEPPVDAELVEDDDG